MSDTREKIRTFIAEDLLMGSAGELTIAQDLLLSGLVDSLGVMRLVYFLEEELACTVPHTDITIENFNNIEAIAAYVEAANG